jgi:DNA-binding NarL/FixJ family response regulator
LEAYTDIQVLGEAANGNEAVTLAQTMRPDVVLMDINMPKMNGIEATAVIKRDFPNMAIVGLSVNADTGNREAIIQAGAATLLTKEAPMEELYHAIQSAATSLPDRISTPL